MDLISFLGQTIFLMTAFLHCSCFKYKEYPGKEFTWILRELSLQNLLNLKTKWHYNFSSFPYIHYKIHIPLIWLKTNSNLTKVIHVFVAFNDTPWSSYFSIFSVPTKQRTMTIMLLSFIAHVIAIAIIVYPFIHIRELHV